MAVGNGCLFYLVKEVKLFSSISILCLALVGISVSDDVEAKGFGGRSFSRPSFSRSVPKSAPKPATKPAKQVEKYHYVERTNDSGSVIGDVVTSATGAFVGMAAYDALTKDEKEQTHQSKE